MQRIPPSTQMREALMTQLELGTPTLPGGPAQPFRAFVARAAELVLQVGIEEQLTSFLGRGPYEREGGTRTGYRNGYGHHTLKTEAGRLGLRPPKVRGTAEPFALQLPAGLTTSTPELRALVTRAYVRGLSDRDVEGLYAEVFGGTLSKSAVSQATKSLQADFDAWRKRDLSELKVVYVFLDGQYHAVRPGSREKEGVLAAYALLEDGRMVLLHLGLGPRERTETWVAFLHELTARGLATPVLLVSDGNPGLRKALKQVFPGVRTQRCVVHKLRNILAKLPRLAARELKPLVKQIFEAPDHRTALRRGKALLARYRDRYPAAMECLEQDLAECVTYLLFPREHWKRIRTTNLLERTFAESRRRTKVIPRFPGEAACLRLVFATLVTASQKWRGVKMTPKILRALDKLRVETPGTKEQAAA
jgi:transposase-like protein